MADGKGKSSMRDRVTAVLNGQTPDRLPFIDRMELWYASKSNNDALPDRFKGMSLNDVHRAVGMGRQKFSTPYAFKLHGVEVVATFENEIVKRQSEPVWEYFPAASAPEVVPRDKAGTTLIEFFTPAGNLNMKFVYAESMVDMGGAAPLLTEHLVKSEDDFRTVEYIIERAAFVPLFENIFEDEKLLGDNGFAVPFLHRIPFQQLLLEYLGEMQLFTAIYDNPKLIDRLMTLLDTQYMEILKQLSGLSILYVEFQDNLDGMMTNPKLFEKYALPYYQKYTDLLHGQGKKVGCHTDGNVKSLLELLTESGLDVCESFSPFPLTECTFEQAWETWRNGPIIWGGIPSPILEERTSEADFKAYVHRLLQTIGDRPIILGVGDMVLGNNLIERVEYIAEQVEKHPLN
jgi:uroporphyrinogen-III decarboxylase